MTSGKSYHFHGEAMMPTQQETTDAAIAAAIMCTIWFAAMFAAYCALTGTFTI